MDGYNHIISKCSAELIHDYNYLKPMCLATHWLKVPSVSKYMIIL